MQSVTSVDAQLSFDLTPSIQRNDFDGVIEKIGRYTRLVSSQIPAQHKKRLSQYFTPMPIAQTMASMTNLQCGASIGDYGAGTGILSATLLASHYHEVSADRRPIRVSAYEIDSGLHEGIRSLYNGVGSYAIKEGFQEPLLNINGDFFSKAQHIFSCEQTNTLDSVVLNPPYQKLKQSTPLARLFIENGIPVPNLYAAFIVLSIQMLKQRGELVAIVPRSFCSGPYFRKFREWLMEHGAIDWFVRFNRRSNVFRGDNVLQENVIFRFVKGKQQPACVRVTLSSSPEELPEYEGLVPSKDIFPNKGEVFFVPGSLTELNALHYTLAHPHTLDSLGLKVSTGKLEDFRVKDDLRTTQVNGAFPVLYAQHWSRGETNLQWEDDAIGKQCWYLPSGNGVRRLVKAGHYVAIKRISANDDRSGRCHPVLITPDSMPGSYWAIDNHIQLVSNCIPEDKWTKKLVEYLSSANVNNALRVISGTTQINCSDLKLLRYPKL